VVTAKRGCTPLGRRMDANDGIGGSREMGVEGNPGQIGQKHFTRTDHGHPSSKELFAK
jgi:hypothetical protein